MITSAQICGIYPTNEGGGERLIHPLALAFGSGMEHGGDPAAWEGVLHIISTQADGSWDLKWRWLGGWATTL